MLSDSSLGESASSATVQLTAAASTATIALAGVPDAADAALTPSLKNFLLSIVAGGTLLGLIVGAVIGVSQVDKVGFPELETSLSIYASSVLHHCLTQALHSQVRRE
jgi:hypothetical protein